jgi:hypothetical protein
MCFCSEDHLRWYLDRNLADVIRTDPLSIQLNFEPGGRGKADWPFYLQRRENKCCVCGGEDKLSKHHVVPYKYRKALPCSAKTHHDVLPICVECHRRYERDYVPAISEKLAFEHDAPIRGRVGEYDLEDFVPIKQAAACLVRFRGRLPAERRQEMYSTVEEFLGRPPTGDDLQDLMRPWWKRDDYIRHAEMVAAKITDVDEFYRMWRQHFLDTMEPKHMPDGWSVDHSVIAEALT